MESPIILNARLKVKRSAIESNEKAIAELEEKKTTILRSVEEAETEEDVERAAEEAENTDKDIEKIQDDIATLKQEVSDIESKLEENNDTSDSDEGAEGDEREMATKVITPENEKNEEVRSLIDFLNSKGQKRAGIKTSDIGAIIPKQILYDAKDEVETTYDLTKYVDIIKVSQSGGSWNVAKKVDESLHTVEELTANPELKNPALITVDWAVKTYRGSIESSNEAIQDSTELKRLIQKTLDTVVLNTKNRLIVEVLKKATAKTANGVNELKDIINVDLDPAYTNRVVIASQSAFNFLDKMQDNDGHWLMQPDVTSATGYRLLGMPIAPVADALIGSKAGDMVAFIGDAKRFVKFFDRDEVQIGWATNENYAQQLLAALRVDVKEADTEAGYMVTFSPKA